MLLDLIDNNFAPKIKKDLIVEAKKTKEETPPEEVGEEGEDEVEGIYAPKEKLSKGEMAFEKLLEYIDLIEANTVSVKELKDERKNRSSIVDKHQYAALRQQNLANFEKEEAEYQKEQESNEQKLIIKTFQAEASSMNDEFLVKDFQELREKVVKNIFKRAVGKVSDSGFNSIDTINIEKEFFGYNEVKKFFEEYFQRVVDGVNFEAEESYEEYITSPVYREFSQEVFQSKKDQGYPKTEFETRAIGRTELGERPENWETKLAVANAKTMKWNYTPDSLRLTSNGLTFKAVGFNRFYNKTSTTQISPVLTFFMKYIKELINLDSGSYDKMKSDPNSIPTFEYDNFTTAIVKSMNFTEFSGPLTPKGYYNRALGIFKDTDVAKEPEPEVTASPSYPEQPTGPTVSKPVTPTPPKSWDATHSYKVFEEKRFFPEEDLNILRSKIRGSSPEGVKVLKKQLMEMYRVNEQYIKNKQSKL
jgi:hypothetical protein